MAREASSKAEGKTLQELLALPEMQAASVDALRRQGTLSKALPPIAQLSSERLVGYSTKAADALRLAQEIGIANAFTRADVKRREMIAQARDQAIEQALVSQSRNTARRIKQMARGQMRARDQYIKRFAGAILGVGRDLYR